MSTTNQNENIRRSYDKQFKIDAVKRVLSTGKSCAEVGRELGICGHMLARWQRNQLKTADAQSAETSSLKPSELAEQLRLARLESEDLREQRDILKKAAAYVAKDAR